MDAVTGTTEVQVYPAWQAKVRAAQEATEAKINEQLAKEEEEKQQRNLEQGKMLQRVLAMFGIEAEAPTENRVEIDNIGFILHNIGSSWGGIVLIHESDSQFRFDLGVYYRLPERYREEYSLDYHAPISDRVDVGWTDEVRESHLSLLAYAIDRVTENAESFIKQMDARTLRSQDAPTPVPPSAAEQLVTIIRQIIREETAEAEAW